MHKSQRHRSHAKAPSRSRRVAAALAVAGVAVAGTAFSRVYDAAAEPLTVGGTFVTSNGEVTASAESISASKGSWGIEELSVPKVTKPAAPAKTDKATRSNRTPAPSATPTPSAEPATPTPTPSETAAEAATEASPAPKAAAKGSASGAKVAELAASYAGSPYVSGGNTPSGWDCSGFTQWIFKQFGYDLPHFSGSQASAGAHVSYADAQPGDLMVLKAGGHVGIYLGNGQMVHALNPSQGTMVTSVNYSGGIGPDSFTFVRVAG